MLRKGLFPHHWCDIRKLVINGKTSWIRSESNKRRVRSNYCRCWYWWGWTDWFRGVCSDDEQTGSTRFGRFYTFFEKLSLENRIRVQTWPQSHAHISKTLYKSLWRPHRWKIWNEHLTFSIPMARERYPPQLGIVIVSVSEIYRHNINFYKF